MPPPPASAPPAVAPGGEAITLDSLIAAFDGALLDGLEQRVRTRFRSGRFLSIDGDIAVFGVPNAHYQPRVVEVKTDVEQAIHAMFGRSVTIDVTVDGNATPPPGSRPATSAAPVPTAGTDEEIAAVGDINDLADAKDIASTGIDRITQAFPGATVVPPPNN